MPSSRPAATAASSATGAAGPGPWPSATRGAPAEVVAVLPLVDVSISTSGDYERFFEHDGVRCHHLIDPRSGRSPSSVHSVTILADDGLTSEALSKCVFVLGVQDGLRLIEAQPGVDAVVVDAAGRLALFVGAARRCAVTPARCANESTFDREATMKTRQIHPAAGLTALAASLLAPVAVAVAAAAAAAAAAAKRPSSLVRDVPLAYVKRVNTLGMNPTDGTPSAPGGDLMVREKSSPSAPEHNLTRKFTQGKGDASDPEVSYDGKKIVFSMRCPTSNTSTIGGVPACTGRWNIWEYDMSSGGLTGGTFRRLTASTSDDDVDPAYLPAGRGFVFSSNRQTKSKTFQAVGSEPYFALDEYERERVLNLHTMDADGGAIEQISFNQSHDRNPVVRPNGDIMFSRWEHVGPRNRFAIFRTKPDGTDMFVLYGAQSPGNSFLHPRDMDPKGKYKGFVSSSLMSLVGHAGRRRADVHRRGQLLRTQHAGQQHRADAKAGRAKSPPSC